MSLLVDDVSVRIPRALTKFVEQDVVDGRGPGSRWEHAYPVLKPWRICRLFSPTRRQVASATYHRPANSDPLRESTTHGVVPRARSYASTRAGMCAQLRMCGRERVRPAARVRESIMDRIEKKPVRHEELRLQDMKECPALVSSVTTSWRTGPLTRDWITSRAWSAVRRTLRPQRHRRGRPRHR